MTRKEQEKLGKEIVEKLNRGESVRGINISIFYNIKQFHYIKIEEISLDKFDLIVLPEDYDGESLLEIKLVIFLNIKFIDSINLENNLYFDAIFRRYRCFTKFKLTGDSLHLNNLDYWLVRRNEKFRWILKKLKINDPEYNLAMYELFGFNEEYIRRELGYFKDICK